MITINYLHRTLIISCVQQQNVCKYFIRQRIYVESQHPAGSSGVLWAIHSMCMWLVCFAFAGFLPVSGAVDAFYSLNTPHIHQCHFPHTSPPEKAKVCQHKQLLRRIIAIKMRLKWAERPSKRAGFIGLNTWQWSTVMARPLCISTSINISQLGPSGVLAIKRCNFRSFGIFHATLFLKHVHIHVCMYGLLELIRLAN